MNIYQNEIDEIISKALRTFEQSGREFQPTYLYIKQHSVTGKLYFGKTIKNPEKYKGSGHYWIDHINVHGKEHVITLWYCLFYNIEEIIKFAVTSSYNWNIILDKDKNGNKIWANLVVETGIDGGFVYNSLLHEHHSVSKKQVLLPDGSIKYIDKNDSRVVSGELKSPLCEHKRTKLHCENISKARKGKTRGKDTQETKDKRRDTLIDYYKSINPEYHTPYGIFFSTNDVALNFGISQGFAYKIFNDPFSKLTSRGFSYVIKRGKDNCKEYFKEHMIDKTWKENGFYKK